MLQFHFLEKYGLGFNSGNQSQQSRPPLMLVELLTELVESDTVLSAGC